jgi:hypothetical protein
MSSSRSRKTKKEAAQEVSFEPVLNKCTGRSKIKLVPVPTASPSQKKRRLSKATSTDADIEVMFHHAWVSMNCSRCLNTQMAFRTQKA